MNRVSTEISIHWRYLHQDKGLTWRQIHSDKQHGYDKFYKATICRHMKKLIGDKILDKRSLNKGQPKKITDRDRRHILRQVEVLRSRGQSNFTVKRIKIMAGLTHTVCDESVRLVLASDGLAKRYSARKGILSKEDLKKRLTFAKTVKARFQANGRDLWTQGISFYLDGASFTHKYHPLDQAQAPKTRIWRRPNERLSQGLTAKSAHEGVGGRQAHFMVGIGYSKGVVFCEQYLGRLNGQKFAEFVRTHLPQAFRDGNNPRGKVFLQDGDPSQNSKKAKRALIEIGASKFSIPARSPDLNPIENIFHLAKAKLQEDAIVNNIEFENWDDFCARVKSTIEGTQRELIDKTISSMERRIDLIINSKGERTRY
jgi:hypothetical protein